MEDNKRMKLLSIESIFNAELSGESDIEMSDDEKIELSKDFFMMAEYHLSIASQLHDCGIKLINEVEEKEKSVEGENDG